MIGVARYLRDEWRLPKPAKMERQRDAQGLMDDPGIDAVVDAAAEWLALAQDRSRSEDGGVARDYSLVSGWATSYPETTGYIVPTMIEMAARRNRDEWRDRARRMLDWLVSIQFESGAFQGGRIDAWKITPVTFNTGQILIGLAVGQREFGAYEGPARRAADWLVETQDPDGCWRKFPTPFGAAPGEKAYETHVSWGLFEAERALPGRGYQEAGLKQVRWALGKQRDDGWIADCCLTHPEEPLTHTIGYALRGIVEAFRISQDEELLAAARRTADGLLGAIDRDGFLPGRMSAGFVPVVDWACLTGTVQIAHSWLLLGKWTGDERYVDAGTRANRYVRRTIRVDGPPETRGAVKGSFPVDGAYGTYQYLNWAAKFMIDANWCEKELSGPA